ncbi:MAG: dihydroxyacetone kinase phosphoryl donor subunit DhaM [Propionicimonas sp.]
MSVALVIVSHSAKLADGIVELAEQMARDIPLRAAGGTDDGRIGTSFDKVFDAVTELRQAGHDVVILTDLGSATMTVESVLDFLDDDELEHVRFADGPLVEGAVAAAVAAQVGGTLADVAQAALARELFASG